MVKSTKKTAKQPVRTRDDRTGKIAQVAPSKRRRTTSAAGRSPASGGSPRSRARTPIPADIVAYNTTQSRGDKRICDALAQAIHGHFSGTTGGVVESKIWHRHPVWFIDGNPIVGYHKLKDCVRLLFWSGQSFDEPGLAPEGTFKAAEARFTAENQISPSDLKRWLEKSKAIQWDYKNIMKRKGRLERL